MSGKFALFFLAVFAFQAGQCAFEPFDLQRLHRGMIEDAIQKVIEKIRDVVQNAINAAIAGFEKVWETINALAGPLIDKALEEMTHLAETIIQKIHDLIEEAAQGGINAQECVGESLDEIKALPGQTIQNIKVCVDKNLGQLSALKDKAITEILGFKDRAEELIVEAVAELHNCGFLDIVCIGSQVAQAGINGFQLAKDVTDASIQTIKDFNKIQGEVILCQTANVATFISTVNGIFKDVKTCIDNKVVLKLAHF